MFDQFGEWVKNLKPVHYLIVSFSLLLTMLVQKFVPQVSNVAIGFFQGMGDWLRKEVWGLIDSRSKSRKNKKMSSYEVGRKIQELIDFKKQVLPVLKEVKTLRKGYLECQKDKERCGANLESLRREFYRYKREQAS